MNSKSIPRGHSTTKNKENQEKIGYVYRHIRLDKNEVFYIGIGTMDKGKYYRAYFKHGRNPFWNYIVNKTKYEVEILFEDLPSKELYAKEKELIKLYGRRNNGTGTLVNLTDGGESNFGYIPTEETRRKMSENSPNKTKVILFDYNDNFVKEYETMQAMKSDGFNPGGISTCIINPLHTNNGYKFQRISEFLIHGYKKEPDIHIKKRKRSYYTI